MRKLVVIDGLTCDDPTGMAWRDGERERWWSHAAALDHGRERDDWPLAASRAGKLSDLAPEQIPWLIAKGPDAPARALLSTSRFLRHRRRADMGRVAVARFELDAEEFALGEAAESADLLGHLVMPFRGPAVATLVAGWLRHTGSARLWARLWLCRHAEAAARALIPAAAGRPGRARQNAEEALRFLSASGHGPILLKTAMVYGPPAHDLVEALSAGAPAAPARSGRTPEWLLPENLPPLRTAAGALMPEDHVTRLIGALTGSRLDDPPEPAPGDLEPPRAVESASAVQPMVRPADPQTLRLIGEAEPTGLAAFGRALLDGWVDAGMPPAEAWVVCAQAHIGDEETNERLAPLIRSWPAKGRHARAAEGYAVLAAAGTDTALRHLLAIEANMVGGPMNDRASAYLGQAAAARGLTVTQLADRTAITHGLDAGLAVDYGPRSFPVRPDEHLVAHVVAADGRMLARPPKPGVKDTRPEAYQWFLGFKKELRATAVFQTGRLEQDMLRRRLRPARDLPSVLLPHPILGPLARRLLWGEYDGRRLVRALRVAEDGSLADREDHTAVVAGDTPLGIVHPADLGQELTGWAQLFADYEILQPFPQVNRPVVTFGDRQRAGFAVPGTGPIVVERILALMRAGWLGNGYHLESREHTQLIRELPGGLALVAEMRPGMPTSGYRAGDEFRITEVWVDERQSEHWQRERTTPIGAADPAALSELLVELRGQSGSV
ncbi:DUF4132 domain-containing protein [Actinoplanes sp. G11-F43]|uniref:DUF4132 domain-containing protein n=1 Tax=Actinoplanes sp. G11-F43 TaxID=3424130 RepID=UPI003D348503